MIVLHLEFHVGKLGPQHRVAQGSLGGDLNHNPALHVEVGEGIRPAIIPLLPGKGRVQHPCRIDVHLLAFGGHFVFGGQHFACRGAIGYHCRCRVALSQKEQPKENAWAKDLRDLHLHSTAVGRETFTCPPSGRTRPSSLNRCVSASLHLCVNCLCRSEEHTSEL